MNLYIVFTSRAYSREIMVAAESAHEAVDVVASKDRLWNGETQVTYTAWQLARATGRTKAGRVYGLSPDGVGAVVKKSGEERK